MLSMDSLISGMRTKLPAADNIVQIATELKYPGGITVALVPLSHSLQFCFETWFAVTLKIVSHDVGIRG